MPSEISHKYSLLTDELPLKWEQRATSTGVVCEKYRSTQRIDESAIAQEIDGNDRRAKIFAAVDDALGEHQPNRRVHAPLFCDKYLVDAVYRWLLGRMRTKNSWETYVDRFADWIAFSEKRALDQQIETVPREVHDYLCEIEANGLSMRSIVLARDVLRSWFGWLDDLGLIAKTPINRDIKRSWRIDPNQLSIQNGRRHALWENEAEAITKWLFEKAQPVACLSVLLQMSAGLRSAEVAGLNRPDMMEREGVCSLTVHGKGAHVRVIVLEPVVVAAWKRYAKAQRLRGNRGPLLVRPGGGHYTPRRVQQWAQQAARIIHRHNEISSHGLRRTAATLLVDRGARLDQVQNLLGHSSIEQTAKCYVVRRKPLEVTTGITEPKESP